MPQPRLGGMMAHGRQEKGRVGRGKNVDDVRLRQLANEQRQVGELGDDGSQVLDVKGPAQQFRRQGIDGNEPVQLSRGDFVLLPSTPAFALFSQPGADCVDRDPTETAVRHGEQEGEPDFEMLGGAFQIEMVNAPLLIALLPGMIHIRSSDGGTGRLRRIIDLIAEECGSDHPGKEMILQRLLEVMLVESVRWRSLGEDALPAGSDRDCQLPKASHRESILRPNGGGRNAGRTSRSPVDASGAALSS